MEDEIYTSTIAALAEVTAAGDLPITSGNNSFLPLQIFSFLILFTIIGIIIKKLFFNNKRCPYCQSKVHKKAIFCKHCRKDI